MNRHFNAIGRSTSLIMLACLLCCVCGDAVAWGCPNCRDGLAGDPDQANFVQSLFWSILFLLSMPFLIFASLGGYFYWLIHRAQAAAPVPVSKPPYAVTSLTEEAAIEEELEVAGV